MKITQYIWPFFMLAAFSIESEYILNFFIYDRDLAPELMVAGITTIEEVKRKHPFKLKIVDVSDKEIWLDAQWYLDN